MPQSTDRVKETHNDSDSWLTFSKETMETVYSNSNNKQLVFNVTCVFLKAITSSCKSEYLSSKKSSGQTNKCF